MEDLKQYLLLNPDSTYYQIYQKFEVEIWEYLNEQDSKGETFKRIIESFECEDLKIQNESDLLSAIAAFACLITFDH
jgi:hypothetical protein